MKTLLLAGLATTLLSFASLAHAGVLKVGVTPGAYADSVAAAAEEAKAQGLDVEVVEFSDWTTPNIALAAGTSTSTISSTSRFWPMP